MRLKDLRGLPVIDPTAARKIGTVSDYQVDPGAGRVAALDVTPADSGPGERILAERIRRVGKSAVILTIQGGSMPSSPTELNERWLDTSTMVGLEVMGDDGTRIGHLVDAMFDQDNLTIDAYLLGGGSLLDSFSGRRNRIEPDNVHSCSRELMMVTSRGIEPAVTVESREAAEPVEPVETVEPARPVEVVKPVRTRKSVDVGPTEETAPLEAAAVPLKDADKMPKPNFETVPDGHPVSGPHS
jgi:sporulation protein YlmC with PRC-barrel domain